MSELEKFKLEYEDIDRKFYIGDRPFAILKKLLSDVYALLERIFDGR